MLSVVDYWRYCPGSGCKCRCLFEGGAPFCLLYYYMRNFCNLIGAVIRAVVFRLFLEYLHVKITNLLGVIV